jgi:hypothetical protein
MHGPGAFVDLPFAIVFLSTRAHGASNQSIVSISNTDFPIHLSSKAFFRTIYCRQAEYYRVNMCRVRLGRERDRVAMRYLDFAYTNGASEQNKIGKRSLHRSDSARCQFEVTSIAHNYKWYK